MSSTVVVIPARLGSTRFPAKVLARLAGKPVLRWCWEAAVRSKVGRVLVATDDGRVEAEALEFGAETVLTAPELGSGTERVAAALKRRGARWVVNLQGDEPLIRAETIRAVARLLQTHPRAEMSTAAAPLRDRTAAADPNVVKVVSDRNGRALYFSRSPIPNDALGRANGGRPPHRQHLGIYGYQRRALDAFLKLKPTALEGLERLEQLRALENGWTIMVAMAPEPTVAIDVPDDLKRAEAALSRRPLGAR